MEHNYELITEFNVFKNWFGKPTYTIIYENPIYVNIQLSADAFYDFVQNYGLEGAIREIESEYGIDLSYYESDIEEVKEEMATNRADEELDGDDEDYDSKVSEFMEEIDDDDAFEYWFNNNYKSINKELENINEKLYNVFERRDADEVVKPMIDDFNESTLEKYIDKSDVEQPKRILSIRAIDYDYDKSTFRIDVKVKGKPDDKLIENIKSYIEGQCSDGWGEGFEQQEIIKYLYLKTWLHKGENKIKHIETEKVG